MVNVIESLARRQLVGLLDLFQSPDGQEHANRRAQSEEVHRLKIQRVVDHRHLRRKTFAFWMLVGFFFFFSLPGNCLGRDLCALPAQCRLQSSCSWRERRRSCCQLGVAALSDQGGFRPLVGAWPPGWPLWPPLCAPEQPAVQPVFIYIQKEKRKKLFRFVSAVCFCASGGSRPTCPPACSLSLWQTWQSFSWDPEGSPSPSDPLLCTWAARDKKIRRNQDAMQNLAWLMIFSLIKTHS